MMDKIRVIATAPGKISSSITRHVQTNRTDRFQIQIFTQYYTSWHILSRTTRNIEQKWGLGCQFLCKTDDFSQNRVIDDNLVIFDVQSDCTGVKMCDNTFSGGFKLYCVTIEGVRDKKNKKNRFTKILKKQKGTFNIQDMVKKWELSCHCVCVPRPRPRWQFTSSARF